MAISRGKILNVMPAFGARTLIASGLLLTASTIILGMNTYVYTSRISSSNEVVLLKIFGGAGAPWVATLVSLAALTILAFGLPGHKGFIAYSSLGAGALVVYGLAAPLQGLLGQVASVQDETTINFVAYAIQGLNLVAAAAGLVVAAKAVSAHLVAGIGAIALWAAVALVTVDLLTVVLGSVISVPLGSIARMSALAAILGIGIALFVSGMRARSGVMRIKVESNEL